MKTFVSNTVLQALFSERFLHFLPTSKQLRDKKNTMKISRETLSARDIAFRDKTLYMLLTYIGRVVPSQGQRVHRVTMQQRLECELCTRDTRFCWQGGDKRQMGGG